MRRPKVLYHGFRMELFLRCGARVAMVWCPVAYGELRLRLTTTATSALIKTNALHQLYRNPYHEHYNIIYRLDAV